MTGRGRGLNVAAASAVAVVAAVAGPSAAWAVPEGAVGGIQSPASLGALQLSVLATESEGVGLHSATALIDGQVRATALFEDGACRTGSEVACPALVTLDVLTQDLTDGEHQLDVVIEDEEGRQAVKRHRFEVDNTPPVSNPTVTVDVSSGSTLPSPPGDGDPPSPGGGPACASPRLSMFLAQDPLRHRRGVPVLAEGRRYRFRGRLTCRVDGRRRAAPRGTQVQVLHRTPRRLMIKPSLAVRGGGRISARLAFQSRRVVIFRVRGASVRIPIRTAAVRRGRA